MSEHTKENNLPEIIRTALLGRPHRKIEDPTRSYRHAAVLIPIFRGEREYGIVFTKRTNTVEAHKGQISFPGGRVDEPDASPEAAALREAEEEVGLQRKDVDLLGRIDDQVTSASNFLVHPFVGLIPYPYDFRISPEEVDRIVMIPFRIFLEDGAGDRILPVRYEDSTFNSIAYTYDDDVIWGATARIMKNLVQILRSSRDGLNL